MLATWHDARVGTLRKLWAEGFSASQIAKQLGQTTRNAVIGKLHRMGLSYRITPARLLRRTRRTRPVDIAARRYGPPKITDRRPLADDVRIADLAPLDPKLGVLKLNQFTCRYPSGDPKADDFAFCGRTCEGPYCATHAALSYTPSSRKARLMKTVQSWLEDRTRRSAWQAAAV